MTSSQTSDEVIFTIRNNAGIITLNRPKSLNALNVSILSNLLSKLLEWENNKNVVIIKGTGKAFCAGGDVRYVAKTGDLTTLINVQYKTNNVIGQYRIPYIALIDGITMGGGLGVSVHGKYRVATEKTIIAMPETKIGGFPGVGGTYFLPRLPHHIGFYLGLTSSTIAGQDVHMIGVATHFVPSHRLPDLEKALSECISDTDVKTTLEQFHEITNDDKLSIAPYIKDIDYCFAASSIDEILARLKLTNNKWANDTIKAIHQMCPTSVKITLRALHRGAKLSLAECLQMEYRLVNRLGRSYNFHEGVRALLVDRDNKPRWKPSSLAEVSEDSLDPYFDRLPENEELKFLNSKL